MAKYQFILRYNEKNITKSYLFNEITLKHLYRNKTQWNFDTIFESVITESCKTYF